MDSKLIIKIKKRSQTSWLIWLLVWLPFLFGTLNDLLKLPWAIRYLLDVAWIVLVYFQIRSYGFIKQRITNGIATWTVYLLTITFLVYLVQCQSPLYYLWGVRNNFRFYAAFLAFSVFLLPQEAEEYTKLFDILFWINCVVSLIQYAFLGLDGDHLGGIFSTEVGGNGYTNIFFSVIITKSVLFYLEKKETTWQCMTKCMAALLIAALAELKFFFVEFVIILVLSVLFTNFTWRKFCLILGGGAAVTVGAALLSILFPNFANFFSLDWFAETATSDKGYTSSGDMNRLTAIPMINELWLKTWGERLFGLGLGNCDTSTFAIVNTPFYEQYGHLHYTWLSYAMIYLECGWIGLIFYFGFFVLVYFGARKIEKRSEGTVKTYCRISRIMAIMCMIISIYNSSLRTEAGYMAYFVMAIPFVFGREFERGRKNYVKTASA